MNIYAGRAKAKQNPDFRDRNEQRPSRGTATQALADNRPEAIAQRRMKELADGSRQVKHGTQLQSVADRPRRAVVGCTQLLTNPDRALGNHLERASGSNPAVQLKKISELSQSQRPSLDWFAADGKFVQSEFGGTNQLAAANRLCERINNHVRLFGKLLGEFDVVGDDEAIAKKIIEAALKDKQSQADGLALGRRLGRY